MLKLTTKCKHMRKQQWMSKNWLYSWQQRFSKILRPFSHSEKLCEDHENNYHWTSGQKPHLIKNDRRIKYITANYVSIVVPVLSTDSSISATAASPTSLLQDRNQNYVICQNDYKNLRRILRMTVSHNTDTHPRVLLVNHLQSRE